jgi:hypothetical protein
MLKRVKLNLLGDFENPEQTDAPQHRDAELRDRVRQSESQLHDGAQHHEAVETVKQRHEVTLKRKI